MKVWYDPENNGPPEQKKRLCKEKIMDLDITRELPIKKPLSAYVHYLNEGRAQLNKSHPTIGVIEQTTILGKRWRQTSKLER